MHGGQGHAARLPEHLKREFPHARLSHSSNIYSALLDLGRALPQIVIADLGAASERDFAIVHSIRNHETLDKSFVLLLGSSDNGLAPHPMVKWLYANRIKSDTATKELIRNEIIQLGPLSVAEKRVLIIFICTAFLWITRAIINNAQSLFKLDDTIIALLCALSLFICPSGKKEMKKEEDTGSILEWSDTGKMAWGILLLFGGGISLAGALENAGLIEQMRWIAGSVFR